MSIYFGFPASNRLNSGVSPRVQDRGLNLLKAKPCDISVNIFVAVHQVAYSSYIANLPAFMYATSVKKRILIGTCGYPLRKPTKNIPWTFPPVTYSFSKKPNDRQLADIHLHSTEIKGRKSNPTFIMDAPNLTKIRSLVSMEVNEMTPHANGTINIRALKSVYVIQSITSHFLLTHVYPAFRHASDQDEAPSNFDVQRKRRKVADSSYVECMANPDSHLEDMEEDDDAEKEEGEVPGSEPGNVQLKYAKPTTTAAKNVWGSVKDVPNSDGIFVPYVSELAVVDTMTVPDVVSRYFMRCLASESNDMFLQMHELRSAWGLISKTDLGKEITHIYKCIEVALRAQASIYPVYNDTIYEGTVICGAGYTLNIGDKVYVPLSYEKLQDEVSEASSHTKAINGIMLYLTEGDDADRVKDCTTMRQLSEVVKEVELDVVDRQSIIKHAYNLHFPNTYWSTSVTNTQAMLHHLISEKELPDDMPMNPKYLFSVDRVELVLSAFGHSAPSFMIPNGPKCGFQMADPPKNLHIRTVGLETAILDMKFVMENGMITNNMNNLSSRHKDTPVNGGPKREIWKMLKMLKKETSGEDDKDPGYGTSLGSPTKSKSTASIFW